MANLAPVPNHLTDEQVLMCPDIMSTGFSGAESGTIRTGDTVALFARGPIGLCATAGARLMGATTIIAVESLPARMEMACKMGADHVVDFKNGDPVEQIMTDGRGVDVAIEALGRQETFAGAPNVLRPGRQTHETDLPTLLFRAHRTAAPSRRASLCPFYRHRRARG
jgi:threonine dehydrogenase-like Zn-dependent dehydrogenase